jgi:hypothetical protein
MNDIHDMLSKTLGDILADFEFTTTVEPKAAPVQNPKPKKAKSQPKPVDTPKKAVNSPKIVPIEENDTEFDLRKAVIYAEILTPKFKNEEF